MKISRRHFNLLYQIVLNFFNFKRLRELHGDKVFVVLSSGHNGSTTVYYNLLLRFYRSKVFHVHVTSDYWWDIGIEKRRNRNDTLRKRYLRFKAENPHKQYVYISMVRDPIERMISSFFHNGKDKSLDSIEWEDILSVSSLDKNIKWYSIEFRECFGIELEDIKFDRKRGYGKYYEGNVHLLVQRLDRLGCNDVLTDYFGPDFGSLISFNERTTTHSGEDYRMVKKRLLDGNVYLEGNNEFRKLFWDD